MGKAYRDVVRGFRGEFEHPPDLVAYPESAEDVDIVLSFASDARAAAIPFGGGTSVVGGVEARVGGDYKGVVSVDMSRMDRVLEVDAVSRAARIQAGALGPSLEDQLREHGLTLRHFPQSFEHSTLGGWIATRSGGHYATLYTHVDDFVESLRVITPAGVVETRRLPGSGAGPLLQLLLERVEALLGVLEARLRPPQVLLERLVLASQPLDQLRGALDLLLEQLEAVLHGLILLGSRRPRRARRPPPPPRCARPPRR